MPTSDDRSKAETRRKIQDAIDVASLKAQGEKNAAELLALDQKHREQLAKAKEYGADVAQLQKTQALEVQNLKKRHAETEADELAKTTEERLRAEAAGEVRSLEQRGKFDAAKLRQLEEAHRQEFAARTRAGEDAAKVLADQASEAQRLREEIAERERQEVNEAEARERERQVRLFELRGENKQAQLLELEMQHQMEVEQHRGNNEALLAMEEYYAERRREIIHKENMAKIEAVRQYGQQATGSVMGIMGAHSRLARARMRSAKIDLDAGKISRKAYEDQAKAAFEFERKQIIAQGVLSGFLGLIDSAKALSAFANLNIAQGALFTASAAKHFTNAAMASEMARHAFNANMAGLGAGRSAGSGGGGGGAPATGGGTTTNAGPRDLEERQTTPTIQFGDIVLSDVPGLLSDEGVRQLGARVAGSVAEEMNRQAGIPGGFRMEG